jgi:hypothetical protein
MSSSFEFTEGRLIPIPCPLDLGHGDFRQYGFHSSRCIGRDCSHVRLQLMGPFVEGEEGPFVEAEEVPYQFVCRVSLMASHYDVWCRTFVELHGYLAYVSPIIQSLALTDVSEILAGIRWRMTPHNEPMDAEVYANDDPRF